MDCGTELQFFNNVYTRIITKERSLFKFYMYCTLMDRHKNIFNILDDKDKNTILSLSLDIYDLGYVCDIDILSDFVMDNKEEILLENFDFEDLVYRFKFRMEDNI